ncbi:MAG: hypothetical protein SFT91_05225, partial [Rickettsiaceae bacterium]|nr:hypothetical protein [Rickettsiaceae bacterium]
MKKKFLRLNSALHSLSAASLISYSMPSLAVGVGAGTTLVGNDANAYTWSQVATLDIGLFNLTGSVTHDFSGFDGTIKSMGGSITGDVDNSVSTGGTLEFTFNTPSVTGLIGATYPLTEIKSGNNAALTTSSAAKAMSVTLDNGGNMIANGDVNTNTLTINSGSIFTANGKLLNLAGSTQPSLVYSGDGTVKISDSIVEVPSMTNTSGNGTLILTNVAGATLKNGSVGSFANPLKSFDWTTGQTLTLSDAGASIYSQTIGLSPSLTIGAQAQNLVLSGTLGANVTINFVTQLNNDVTLYGPLTSSATITGASNGYGTLKVDPGAGNTTTLGGVLGAPSSFNMQTVSGCVSLSADLNTSQHNIASGSILDIGIHKASAVILDASDSKVIVAGG